MLKTGLAWFAGLLAAVLLAGCGGGSGRQGTDLVVTATAPTAPVTGGSTFAFTVSVRNAGSGTASNVTISNLLSNQLIPTGVTCAASGGATCPDGPSMFMSIPTLPAGGEIVLTVGVQLSPQANGTVSNTASANIVDDVDRANNTSTATATAATALSNLVVSGSGPAGTVTGGGTATFTIDVRNDGPDAANNLTLLNNTGSFLVLRASGVSCVASGGATCPATLSASMTVPTLPAGGALAFTIATTVSGGVNGTVTNTFSATAENETSRADNTYTGTATVVTPQTGVFATGVGPAAPVPGGGTASFSMTVGNAGPDPAPSVSIVNNVGSNLVFSGIACTASGGAVCPATLGPVMTATDMPAGGQLVFTVDTRVGAGVSGTLTNTMTVSADNDTNRGDNIATAIATATTPRASLSLSGTGPSASVGGGETATFVMTVANTGPDPATNLRVINTVGGNLTFTGATCVATAPAVCPSAVGVVTEVGTLPVGGKLQFNVNALVSPGSNGAITNTLQATADNAFSPGGNSVVAVGQAVTARSQIAITGVGPQNVPGGTAAAFVMTVTNTGPDTAGSVTLVSDANGLTPGSVTCRVVAAGATCPATPGPTMIVTNMAVGGALEFTFNVNVPAGAQGSIVNSLSATVTTGVRSQTTAVAVGTAYSNNVAATSSPPAGPLAGGQAAVFTVTATNSGPGPAQDVQATIALGAGLSPNGAIGCSAAGGASCPAATAASLTIPTIPAGGALTFTVPAVVVAGTNGNVGVTLTLSAAGDVRAGDNSASASVAATSPDLGVTQSAATQVVAGSSATFTVVVANPVGGNASNLTLTNRLSSTSGAVDLSAARIVCTPAAGAVCPSPVGPDMTLATLPAGRSLTFTIVVPVAEAARGTLTNTFIVNATGDPNPANNAAVTSQRIVDPRGGSYKLFAANGRAYDLTIDFDAGRYTLVGGGQTWVKDFAADASGGFAVAGGAAGERFRLATDLIAGGHDFGSGAIPYVAARVFAGAVADTAGSYNLMTRDFAAGGAAQTHAAVMVITGNQMLVCQTDDTSVRPPGSNCPTGKQRNFIVSAGSGGNAGTFTATEIGGDNEVWPFVLARSDASRVLLAAPAAGAGGVSKLRIALPDAPSLVGGTLSGASTSGNWLSGVQLGRSSVVIGGGPPDAGSFTLSTISNSGVGAMLRANRAASGTPEYYWVMQFAPLAVAFGDGTAPAGTPTAGLLQILMP